MGQASSKSEQAFERLRRWPRASIHLPVTFIHNGATVIGAIQDLSEGGLRLRADSNSAAAGDYLDFEIVFVPGLKAESFRGLVIWRFEGVFGIEFAPQTTSEQRSRHILRKIVTYHLGVS